MSLSWLWILHKWSHLLEHRKFHLSSVLQGSSVLLVYAFPVKVTWKWYQWSSSYSSSETVRLCGLSCHSKPCTIISHFLTSLKLNHHANFSLFMQFSYILHCDSVFLYSFTLLWGSIRFSSSDHSNHSQCRQGWPGPAGYSSATSSWERGPGVQEIKKAGELGSTPLKCKIKRLLHNKGKR